MPHRKLRCPDRQMERMGTPGLLLVQPETMQLLWSPIQTAQLFRAFIDGQLQIIKTCLLGCLQLFAKGKGIGHAFLIKPQGNNMA